MELPAGFTVSLPGGVTAVRCDRCGAGRSRAVFLPGDVIVLEVWAAEHAGTCEKTALSLDG